MQLELRNGIFVFLTFFSILNFATFCSGKFHFAKTNSNGRESCETLELIKFFKRTT